MSKRPSIAALIAASILGGIAGAVVMQAVSAGTPEDSSAPPIAASDDAHALEARVDAMGKQLRELEARQRAGEAANGERDPSETPDQAPGEEPAMGPRAAPSDEEVRAQSRKELADRDAAFLNEPIHAAWSRTAGADMDHDLNTLAEASGGKFDVMDVSCRSSSCRSTLRFDNRNDAVDIGHGLLRGEFKVNCERHIYTIEPDPDAPPSDEFIATLFFDCSKSNRAEPP